ncbi:MAG: ABC transporter substrate-binding protein [Pseudomonadota bacterium]
MILLKKATWAFLLSVVAVSVSPAAAQDRIVSVGGDVTEIIYALGLGDAVVATDSTSVYPAAATQTPKVGYLRQLSAEGVLSLEPDLIVISGAAGPPVVIDQLRDSGVKILETEAAYTLDSILKKVDRIADLLSVREAGAELRDRIEADSRRMAERVERLGLSPEILFFVTLRNGAPRAAGTETAAHGVIELLGGVNSFAGHTGYKALSLEAAVAADPDIILVMSHHAERLGGADAVKAHPAISLTSAANEGRIVLVDPVTVMQFSPRTPSAVADLAETIASRADKEL